MTGLICLITISLLVNPSLSVCAFIRETSWYLHDEHCIFPRSRILNVMRYNACAYQDKHKMESLPGVLSTVVTGNKIYISRIVYDIYKTKDLAIYIYINTHMHTYMWAFTHMSACVYIHACRYMHRHFTNISKMHYQRSLDRKHKQPLMSISFQYQFNKAYHNVVT